MSAIMLVLGEQYGILCGETMFCLDSGEKSSISKIKMVEDSLLYGFAGRNTSAVEFFGGLIDHSLNPTQKLCGLSYQQLIDFLDKRFELYKKDGVTGDFDVFAIVCGPGERGMQCTKYQIKPQGYIREVAEGTNSEIKIIGSFMNEHLENFILDPENKDLVENVLSAFQHMIDVGIEFDDSINNKMEAYFINAGRDKLYVTQKLQ